VEMLGCFLSGRIGQLKFVGEELTECEESSQRVQMFGTQFACLRDLLDYPLGDLLDYPGTSPNCKLPCLV
jgi:hypothetical protein